MKKTGFQNYKYFAAIVYICFVPFLFGDGDNRYTVKALKIGKPILIDGELNEAVWKEYRENSL